MPGAAPRELEHVLAPLLAVPSAARLWVPPHLWDRAGLALSLAVLRDHLRMPPPWG